MARPARPDLHDALLDAARAEFALRGLDRARVEDIARRASASKGAFYLHFQSKEQAFEEILQRFMGALEDQARRREEAEASFRMAHARLAGRDLHERQLKFDCDVDVELLEVLWRNRQIVTVIESAGGAQYQRSVAEFRRRMQAFVSARMAEKQATGFVRRDVDPQVLGDILVGTYEGFARRMAGLKEKPDLSGWLRSFVQVIYDGCFYAVPAGRPGRRGGSPAARHAGPRGVTGGSHKESS